MVSVVLPAYAMGRYIGEALASIAAQSFAQWEVLVVDDRGPEDGSEQFVKDFAKRMAGHRVEWLRHDVNKGVSAARNSGIHAARGEYVAFLDPDDVFLPGHLAAAVALLDGPGGYDVAAASVESFRDDPGASWTHKAWIKGWRSRHFPHSLAVYNFIQPSSVVVRRSALLQMGGFDTTPELQHIEDYDLWIRLAEGGHRFGFIHAIAARYRKHAGGATAQEARFKALHVRLVAKHPDFFHEGLRRMMRMALEDVQRHQEHERGPLMSTLLWLDDLALRILKKLGITS